MGQVAAFVLMAISEPGCRDEPGGHGGEQMCWVSAYRVYKIWKWLEGACIHVTRQI